MNIFSPIPPGEYFSALIVDAGLLVFPPIPFMNHKKKKIAMGKKKSSKKK